MSAPDRLLVTGGLSDDDRARLAGLVTDLAPDTAIDHVPSLADAGALVERATAIAGAVSPELFGRAHDLRWVHSWAAGADGLLFPEMLDSPVALTSATGNGAVPLAEHAMLLMLMLSRDAPRWQRAQHEARWDRFPHGELAGATVGIVGLGHSGADLAAKARAFHMRVLGLRRAAREPVPGVDREYTPAELHTFLAAADFVVVTAPLTAQTRGMFDAAAFAAMKATAHFICISRGQIADDDALLAALQDGRIAGAGLDAHGVEPLPADSPFWSLPNVIVTPHNGATTPQTKARGVDIYLDNVRRFLTGEPLRNVVDKAAGY
ncbi:D-2-hydroxyacid dehydrogenase [Georgenia halophila]|uniref:D-2-hydroxyacid dehydrogenase n=1 Tax=Georgenia halophila TaxID=620889 RepID=A0ABP8LL69_9MICO